MGARQSSLPVPEVPTDSLKTSLCVVVPTLNEAQGILATVERWQIVRKCLSQKQSAVDLHWACFSSIAVFGLDLSRHSSQPLLLSIAAVQTAHKNWRSEQDAMWVCIAAFSHACKQSKLTAIYCCYPWTGHTCRERQGPSDECGMAKHKATMGAVSAGSWDGMGNT